MNGVVTQLALVGALLCGCTFDHATALPDAPPPDMTTLEPSCRALLMATPGLASGTYMIDPDGAGPDAALSVYCDMTSDAGGWTIVFAPQTPNLITVPMNYTSATQRLLADATTSLMAYRSATNAIVGDYATFALPPDWKLAPPFKYAANEFQTNVAVNGGTPMLTRVKYGYESFMSVCDDPWTTPPGMYGRVCVVGTTAPFFTGFASVVMDTCTESTSAWNGAECAMNKLFTIAVR